MSIINLDKKDRAILTALDGNARMGFAEMGKLAQVSPEVAFHRVKSLEQKGVIAGFQTIIAVHRIGVVANKLYLSLQDATKTVRAQIEEYLMESQSVFWFGVCQGRWDLVIAYWAGNSFDFHRKVNEFQNMFSTVIHERAITFGVDTIQFSRKWLAGGAENVLETDFGKTFHDYALSKNEEEILKYLANNGRMPYARIAEYAHLSVNTVKGNIARLERKGIIAGYKILVDTHRVGFEACKAFVYFKNYNQQRVDELVLYCKQQKNVINVVLCIGPWDMEIECEVENFDEYYAILEELRGAFSDIMSHYESVVFTKEPKKMFMPGCYPVVKDE